MGRLTAPFPYCVFDAAWQRLEIDLEFSCESICCTSGMPAAGLWWTYHPPEIYLNLYPYNACESTINHVDVLVHLFLCSNTFVRFWGLLSLSDVFNNLTWSLHIGLMKLPCFDSSMKGCTSFVSLCLLSKWIVLHMDYC